jgi:signal transduction histidine kinase
MKQAASNSAEGGGVLRFADDLESEYQKEVADKFVNLVRVLFVVGSLAAIGSVTLDSKVLPEYGNASISIRLILFPITAVIAFTITYMPKWRTGYKYLSALGIIEIAAWEIFILVNGGDLGRHLFLPSVLFMFFINFLMLYQGARLSIFAGALLLVSFVVNGYVSGLQNTEAFIADGFSIFMFFIFGSIFSFYIEMVFRKEFLARRALNISRREAEKATQAKDRFVSLVAHDIRNPLGTMISMMKFLQGELDTNNRKTIDEVLQNAKSIGTRLMDMLDELLNISRLHAGKIVAEKQSLVCTP